MISPWQVSGAAAYDCACPYEFYGAQGRADAGRIDPTGEKDSYACLCPDGADHQGECGQWLIDLRMGYEQAAFDGR